MNQQNRQRNGWPTKQVETKKWKGFHSGILHCNNYQHALKRELAQCINKMKKKYLEVET